MKIGVFDSGVGGTSVAKALSAALPEYDIVLRQDKENLPYGTKSPEQLLSLVTPILQEMISAGCEIIVIACNTVTTTIITQLREQIKVPLVGIEPMIKPAANMTKTGVIAVFATPATLRSARYQFLKSEYAPGVKILEPDCSDWALMIEDDKSNELNIKQNTLRALDAGADVIVLGCTHYHWIQEDIMELAVGRAEVIQPEKAIISRLKQVLEQL